MKWVTLALAAILLSGPVAAEPTPMPAPIPEQDAQATAVDMHPRVRLTTSQGDIVVELDREKAPISVDNFLTYVADGHYNGTVFHRVIDGFMIQGGGYTANYERKATRDEITNEADNGLKNTSGTIAMARTRDPHSATAQFFINVSDNAFLDHQDRSADGWGYAVFGRVVAGMDTVDRIRSLPTGRGGPFPKDVPQTPVVIESAILVETTTATEPAAASEPATPTDAPAAAPAAEAAEAAQ